MKTPVLITGQLHPDVVASFKEAADFTVDYAPDIPRAQVLEKVKNAQVIVTRSETPIDKELLDVATELKVIGRAAVGVGNIDVEYATRKGILVINCPGKNTNSAAELSVGLMLSMLRNIPQAHQHMKTGGWDRHMFKGRELKKKSIGIVGLGNVGHRVAKFAHGFDMEVYAYDPYISPDIFRKHNAIRVDHLEELAKTVDIISVHVPLNTETTGLVDKNILLKMRPGSYVVNAARGGIVDEADLLELLEEGHIKGAAIDTWQNEPKPLEKLIGHPSVWVSPHIGATTEEAQLLIGETIFDQVSKAIAGHVVDYPVNLPQIGVIQDPMVKPFAVLAEKLGSLLGQIIEFNPLQIEIMYRGEIAGGENQLVKLAFIKGFTSHVSNGYISFVNAQQNFDKLGISLSETKDPDFSSYKSAIKINVKGQGTHQLSLGGTVFDGQFLRLSLINDFYFEVEPRGQFIFVENDDKPGVVGDLGTTLGKNNINIDCFDLSRNQKGGHAMAVIKTDSEVSGELLHLIQSLPHILRVKSVIL